VGAGPLPVSEPTAQGLFPAEHRSLRELYAMTRQLASHWGRLGERLGGQPRTVLDEGAAAARELLGELADRTAPYGLHGYPAAQGSGARIAGLRNGAGDLLLERNQALRGAVLDAEHVATLLAFLSALAEQRGDSGLAAWHRRWEVRIRDLQESARAAVVALARDPDDAILPADQSKLGRVGQNVANGIGTLGEAFDASALGRLARRRQRSG
jgi:hypothetical protein